MVKQETKMNRTTMYLKGLHPNQSRISDVHDVIIDIFKGESNGKSKI